MSTPNHDHMLCCNALSMYIHIHFYMNTLQHIQIMLTKLSIHDITDFYFWGEVVYDLMSPGVN